MRNTARAIAHLEQADVRVSAQRRLLLELVPEERAFTAQELWELARAHDRGIGRATVFRSLELFTQLGILHRVLGDEGARYRACALGAPTGRHHQLFSCVRCSHTVEFEDEGVEDAIQRAAARRSFHLLANEVVLYGVCAFCRPQPVPLADSGAESR